MKKQTSRSANYSSRIKKVACPPCYYKEVKQEGGRREATENDGKAIPFLDVDDCSYRGLVSIFLLTLWTQRFPSLFQVATLSHMYVGLAFLSLILLILVALGRQQQDALLHENPMRNNATNATTVKAPAATIRSSSSNSLSTGSPAPLKRFTGEALVPQRTALVLVDIQPEYWSDAPSVRKDFPHFPERVKSVLDTMRRKQLKNIVWIRADYDYTKSPWLFQFSKIHAMNSEEHRRSMTYTVKSTLPLQWESFAQPNQGEIVLPKASWNATSNTPLIDILKYNGIDTVLVCGLITSACVQHTSFGLFEAGFRTILIEDACGDRGRERHNAALFLYGGYMYEVLASKDLLDRHLWTRQSGRSTLRRKNPKRAKAKLSHPLWKNQTRLREAA